MTLNMLFRYGARRAQTLVVDPEQVDPVRIEEFMDIQDAAWGARRDVIERAKFNLDLRVSYAGAPLELPDKRPINEEIMDSEAGQRRLAGFMLRPHADRVQASHRDGHSTVPFHFDH